MPRRKAKRGKRSDESLCELGELSRFIDSYVFKIPGEVTSSAPPYKLGCIWFTLHEDEDYMISNTFLLEFKPGRYRDCFISCKEENSDKLQVMVVNITTDVPFDILVSLSESNIFLFTTKSNILKPGDNTIEIYLKPSAFLSLSYASERCINHKKKALYKLLDFFLDEEFDVYDDVDLYDEHQIEKIYEKIVNKYDPALSDMPVSHAFLIPKLRLYQSQAVQWMIKRENPTKDSAENLHILYAAMTTYDGKEIYFHKYGGFFVDQKYYSEEPCKGGILADEMGLGKTLEVLACILLNPRCDLESQNKFYAEHIPNQSKKRKHSFSDDEEIDNSDILQDDEEIDNSDLQDDEYFECVCGSSNSTEYADMPSVKCRKCNVVQHVECVLYRQRSLEYTCPYCWLNNSDLLSSRATLIISPASILHQWEEEILRHIKKDSLKIFMYHGVEHQKFVEPSYLADHDIVLTSYETLRKELNYVDLPNNEHRHSLRHRKKFMPIPSPMCSIEWWRICLDEAQMVESVASKIAKMTGKLHCVNRWCVTGTPIKKSVEDLYGLLLFLEVKPFQEKLWWKEVLWKPFVNGNATNIAAVLKDIAWRTTKEEVIDQIQIPELQEVHHQLEFTPLERVFYDKQHSYCKRYFMEKLEKFSSRDIALNSSDIALNSIDKHVLSKLMAPLRSLQIACCLCKVHKSTDLLRSALTPTELLDHMLKTATYECEEIHRKLIMTFNGLAGIFFLLKRSQEAVQTYENSLKSIEDNRLNFRTDVTQQIHALFHLANVLSVSEKNGIRLESRFTSANLNVRIDQLCSEYMGKMRETVRVYKNNAEKIGMEISSIKHEFKLKSKKHPTSVWCLKVFENLNEEKEVFFEKLTDNLMSAPGRNYLRSAGCFAEGMAKLRAWEIPEKLYQMSLQLHRCRENLIKEMEFLVREPSKCIIRSAVFCHLRPNSRLPCRSIPPCPGTPTNAGEKCIYCKVDDSFKTYETSLFRFDEISDTSPEEENICFSELRRGTHADSDLEICLKFIFRFCVRKGMTVCSEDGANELKLLEALKKEFKSLRYLWLKCSEYVSQKDEIEMAKLSARLIDPNQNRPDSSASFLLYPKELEPRKTQYEDEIKPLQELLAKKLGLLFYLQNLDKAKNTNVPFQEICPICRLPFENSWAVLQCGHTSCLPCIERLFNAQGNIQHKSQIHCPVCRQFTVHSDIYFIDKERANKRKEIQGCHSTKLTAVVECLLNIKKKDPKAKSLVFSSFNLFLSLLESALTVNEIGCVNFCKKTRFQDRLKMFKEDEDISVLLIPLTFGCSGLNLIEASNVLLVEPLLDTSQHLQAIGRIHRIGQKKQTTVHKFVVSKSLEESIYHINLSRNENQASSELTLQDIISLVLHC